MKSILRFLKRLVVALGRLVSDVVGVLYGRLSAIDYRAWAKKILTTIGDGMHWLLFSVLLPKRFRNLTKQEMYNIIFRADSPAGKKFDVWLLVLIALNLIVLIVDSFPIVRDGSLAVRIIMGIVEWGFTLLFTFEFYLRIYCSKHPWKYLFSFYGVIDFISIFPAYLSLFVPATRSLSVLRMLRMLRVFRIFKMRRFLEEGYKLLNALKRSAVKIVIFMMFVFIVAVILGTVVYAIEYEKNPAISSIPMGIYWAVVTLTTVGYGDIAPVTPLGQFISMVVMVLGYSIIAVPTGIVAGETMEEARRDRDRRHQEEKAEKAARVERAVREKQADQEPTTKIE